MPEAKAATQRPFDHFAVFYRDGQEYLEQVGGFVTAGLDRGDPVFIAVPEAGIGLIDAHLGERAGQVVFADMALMGANPAWIIPKVHAFIEDHPGANVRYVGEPIWAARTPEEVREAVRHEALINLAFAGTPTSILCPYDTTRLGPDVLTNAERTHPVLVHDGRRLPSVPYAEADLFPEDCDLPLPPPPGHADGLSYRTEMGNVRAFVSAYAAKAGLSADAVGRLVIAVHELAANTLRHTDGPGTVHVWTTPHGVVCQVADQGHITEPLAGRRASPATARQGHGLWVVHQVCDLIELRTGPGGTTVRLHMRLNG